MINLPKDGEPTKAMVAAGVQALVDAKEADDYSHQNTVIAIYRAMVAASPPDQGRVDEWQPIETAPLKGKILGYDARWGVSELFRSEQMDWWAVAAFNGQLIRVEQLTHWRPLPDPPALTNKDTAA